MVRRAALLAALICSTGCTEPPEAELVVVVQTDMAVPGSIDRIVLQVADTSYAHPEPEGVALSSGDLPATLTLVSDGATRGDITIIARGYLGGELVVMERATTTFVPGEARAVVIWLLDRCREGLTTGCPDGQSCVPDVPGCELERRAGIPFQEAVLDGGLTDAGVDLADAGPFDGGPFDAGPFDAGLADGGALVCVPEVCDGVDNDCDGLVDEPDGNADVGSSLTTTGPHDHCGGCENQCDDCIGGGCGGSRGVEAVIGSACTVVSSVSSSGGIECGTRDVMDSLTASVWRLESGPLEFATDNALVCLLSPAGETVYCVGDDLPNDEVPRCDCSGRCLECPYQIRSLSGGAAGPVTDLAVGMQHGCSIIAGEVFCWGANERGQLGHRESLAITLQATPVSVPGSPTFAQVAAGSRFTCAREKTGSRRVFCWGGNQQGALGRVSTLLTNQDPEPVVYDDDSSELTDVVDLACAGGGPVPSMRTSPHCCVVRVDGEVECWGSGGFGQLDGVVAGVRRGPQRVPRPLGMGLVRDVEVAPTVSCAVTVDDEVWCWGDPEAVLQQSAGTSRGPVRINFSIPELAIRDVSLSRGVGDVEDPHIFAMARTWDGEVYCWGSNRLFQCTTNRGDTITPHRLRP